MVANLLPSALFSALLLWNSVHAVEVIYFYSTLKDACSYGGTNNFPATNLTTDGGVCAFVPSRNRLWACPAPDDNCWGFNVNCQGGTSASAGPNQILCGRSNGNQWCCGENESCTTAPGQINVCIPNDVPNPNSGVSASDAQKKEFSAIPSDSIGTSLPHSTPSAFSTLSPTSSSTSRGSSSGRSGDSSSSASSASSASRGSGTAVGSTAGNSNSSSGGGGISGGAIAGIVIGAIAGILLIVGAVFLLFKRNRRNKTAVGPDGGYYEKPQQEEWNTQYAPSTVDGSSVAGAQHPHSGYYSGEVYAKVDPEMQDPAHPHMPPQEPPQEMPANTKPQELP